MSQYVYYPFSSSLLKRAKEEADMPSKYGFVTVGEEREEYERAERERVERKRTEMAERRKAADDLFARVEPIITNILMDFAWAREWDRPHTVSVSGDLTIMLVGDRLRRNGSIRSAVLNVRVPLDGEGTRIVLRKPDDWAAGLDDSLAPLAQAIANYTGVSTFLTEMYTPDVDHTAPSQGSTKQYESKGKEFIPREVVSPISR